jgi:hypothetical protein
MLAYVELSDEEHFKVGRVSVKGVGDGVARRLASDNISGR